jgi:oligogalacturonide transporter
MLPTTTDVGELMSGARQPGAHAGAMTFFRKGANGLIVAPLIGLVLELAGLEGGTGAVGPGVGEAIRSLFVFGQVGFIGLAFAASFLFRVDPPKFARLRAILERLREGETNLAREDEVLITEVTGHQAVDVLARWTPAPE